MRIASAWSGGRVLKEATFEQEHRIRYEPQQFGHEPIARAQIHLMTREIA
jgi:hypothetical protein